MSFLNSIYVKIAAPFGIATPLCFWAYNKRQSNINHPIMQRAMLHIKRDQRIIDFCGENLRPGYWVSVNESAADNYIKFGFTVKGSSGDLGTSVIADYLTHRELTILETER